MPSLTFLHPFRKYQRMILSQVEQNTKDRKYHIVAPPGAGKTIVGIELINQLGMPAVVFAPTTTIQAQWKDKVGMFLSDPSGLDQITSLDPRRLADINIYTYQLISTPGEEQEREGEIALQEWTQELLLEGQSSDEAAASARIETLRQNNPSAYRAEIAKRYKRAKRKLLNASPAELERFLHPNARELIARLVASGVRTVVLDECHHLLDYWALALRYLISQLRDPYIVGLTATLPSPETDEEYDNYTSLLGDVDFEVPTPAVVKEGDLAPYRDLVYFVEPSQRELDYLNNIQTAFEQAISELTATPRFREWVVGFFPLSPGERTGVGESSEETWQTFCSQSPLFSLACIHFAKSQNIPLSPDLLLPVEAEDPITVEDWALLLEKYGLHVLKISADRADHATFERLRKILLPFGFTITERGLRQSRSVGDLVLTFSESKDQAVAAILQKEHAALGERLRAVVVTDFERMSSGIQTLSGVLDKDAGSALRLFHHLAEDPNLNALSPVLVTGKTFMVTKGNLDALLGEFNRYIEQNRLQATCRALPPDAGNVVEIVGEGADWASRTYVRMATELFDRGVVRCLIGTRGILGEGWDSLSLNTLIDLTSVTTSTSVQQLRGRTIRIDPAWQRKVAHNWDVVCVARSFKKGDVDLKRLVARHGRYWGIVVKSQLDQTLADTGAALIAPVGVQAAAPSKPGSPLPAEQIGRIVRGLPHVDEQLAYELAIKPFSQINFAKYTRRMLAAVAERDRAYDLWGIGQEYSNFSYSASRIDTRDLKIRTVFSVNETIKRILREFTATILSGLFMVAVLACRISLPAIAEKLGASLLCLILILSIGTFGVFLFNLRGAYKIFQKLLVQQPVDAILLDVAHALFFSLRENGLVSRNLQPDYIRVVENENNSYEVLLDYASPADAATFIKAFGEIFDPVRDQRYLILRTDERLPNLMFMPIWLGLRKLLAESIFTKPTYHPVPQVLSTRKELAQVFARYWEKYVGGGELVFTRSDAGRSVLLMARSQRRPKVKGMAFELWR